MRTTTSGYLGQIFWPILLSSVLVLVAVAIRYPPILGSDFATMSLAWNDFQRTGVFNQLAQADPANIANDIRHPVTWWAPGPQLLVGTFESFGGRYGWGMVFWLGVTTLVTVWGYRRLYAELGFEDAIVAWALLGVLVNWHTLYSYRLFHGGEIFANALAPWAAVSLLRVRNSWWGIAAVLTGAILLGTWVKLSFLIVGAALTVSLGFLFCTDAEAGSAPFSRQTLLRLGALVVGLGAGWLGARLLLLTGGPTPADSWAEHYAATRLLHAVLMAFVLPFCSVFALVSSSGRVCDWLGWRHLDANPFLLGGFSVMSAFVYVVVWRYATKSRYRAFLLGFGIVYLGIFTWLYFAQAAVSFEDRHFLPFALLLLPGIAQAAYQCGSRFVKIALAGFFLIGILWGGGSYVYRMRELIRHDQVSSRGYSLGEMPAAVEKAVQEFDQRFAHGNNLFCAVPTEVVLAVRHNRGLQLDPSIAGRLLRGRVDHLVVVVAPGVDSSSMLNSFVDYAPGAWQTRTVAGWTIRWQGTPGE